MSQAIKCIFCLKETASSEEHVIPDSIGGRLTIREVCKDCNSHLSKNVDGPFSEFWYVRLARYALQIGGKRGKIPFPFDGVGTGESGTRVLLSRELQPYAISDVTLTPNDQGHSDLRVVVDASDLDRLPDILQNRLRKALAEHNPMWTNEKLETEIQGIIGNVQQVAPSSTHEPIGQQKVMNLRDWTFEALKISYEVWFRQFGYEWIETSATAEMLRSAILNRDETLPIHGGFGNLPLPPGLLPHDGHSVILMNNGCFVSLFNLGYSVRCEETDSRFMLEQDCGRIIFQERAEEPVKEMLFVDFLGSKLQN